MRRSVAALFLGVMLGCGTWAACATTIVQTVDFSGLQAHMNACCNNDTSSDGEFVLFQLNRPAQYGVSPLALVGASWRLQGVMTIEADYTIPIGGALVGYVGNNFPTGGFPPADGLRGFEGTMPFFNVQAPINCVGGQPCHAYAELAFDVLLPATQLESFFGEFAELPFYVLFINRVNSITQALGVEGNAITGFTHAGFRNAIVTLSYEVPAPGTLALLVAAAFGLLLTRYYTRRPRTFR
jgi:hypothetical protein